jgi:alpha-ribazole phosphatase
MSLWLVRHAQPLIDSGICYGQLDVPADAGATRICAEALLKALPKNIAIACSTLQRCELLAPVLIAEQPDLTYKTDPRLQEMNFGQWEGRPWADIPQAELLAWTDGFANYRAGQTGESVTQFMARVASAFDELDLKQNTLWITHAGVIRAANLIACGIRNITRADQWPIAAPAYAQWCKLDLPNVSQGDQEAKE